VTACRGREAAVSGCISRDVPNPFFAAGYETSCNCILRTVYGKRNSVMAVSAAKNEGFGARAVKLYEGVRKCVDEAGFADYN